ncbi:MAG: PDZ domain-containing protein [Firmicutes bacterium]|nr:PDZ domain-containing protein [Bacillota bacterium]
MSMLLLELAKILVSTLIRVLTIPIFWLVVLLVYLQYRRVAGMEKKFFGRALNPVGRQVAVSTGWGLLAGLLASLFMLLLGLSLSQIGLLYIWPVALLLLLIHPRFLCFSYAGGIVAFVTLALRHLVLPFFPLLGEHSLIAPLLEIHIPALLALVGVLHLIESLLIYLSGHRGSTPLYFKLAGGEVVGAFSLQKFWPIPLVALLATVVLEAEVQGVTMPDWWPLLKPTLELGPGESLQFMALPVLAALGYSDLALSSSPREKSIGTAAYLSLYSVVLIGLALAAELWPWLTLAGVLFAPLGHEAVIHLGNRRERSREPVYRSGTGAVPLMMVLPRSAASWAGLRSGDLIHRVNDAPVHSDLDLLYSIEQSYFMVLLEGSREGKTFSVILNKRHRTGEEAAPFPLPWAQAPAGTAAAPLWHKGAALGLIPAPSPHTPLYAQEKAPAGSSLLRRLTGRKKR